MEGSQGGVYCVGIEQKELSTALEFRDRCLSLKKGSTQPWKRDYWDDDSWNWAMGEKLLGVPKKRG